ncbi:MAG TPA: TonB family protein [Bacteroidia bacterium]|jgi:TonB family protein|nr:TonB family protein [Bacteroidia bacterium]
MHLRLFLFIYVLNFTHLYAQTNTVVVRKKTPSSSLILHQEWIPGDGPYPVNQWQVYDPAVLRSYNGILPVYPGGDTARVAFIMGHTRYTEAMQKADKKGRVVVDFTVDTLGKVVDVSIRTKIGMGCDEEAQRVAQTMPSWKPGVLSGKKVKVKMTMPVYFPPK